MFFNNRIRRQAIITSKKEVGVVKRNAVDISPCTISEHNGMILTHSTLINPIIINGINEK